MHFEFTMTEPAKHSRETPGKNARTQECPLTNREMTIVKCLANGNNSLEIAHTLFISHSTVRTHRKNILRKAGARNVAHLVQLALANGWI